jgi:hypothetical protein
MLSVLDLLAVYLFGKTCLERNPKRPEHFSFLGYRLTQVLHGTRPEYFWAKS